MQNKKIKLLKLSFDQKISSQSVLCYTKNRREKNSFLVKIGNIYSSLTVLTISKDNNIFGTFFAKNGMLNKCHRTNDPPVSRSSRRYSATT